MKLFKNLDSILTVGCDVHIVIRKTASGKMATVVSFTNNSVTDDAKNMILPYQISASAEELDNGFEDEIMQPLQKSAGLQNNMAEYEKSLKAAEAATKKAQAEKAKAKAADGKKGGLTEEEKKAAEEKKEAEKKAEAERKEAERKAAEEKREAEKAAKAAAEAAAREQKRKENLQRLWGEAAEASKAGRFAESIKLLEQCRKLTVSEKQLATLQQSIDWCRNQLSPSMFDSGENKFAQPAA